MSILIINRESKSLRFKPHKNEALGKYVHTKKDYLDGLKEHGLIPQSEARAIAKAVRRDQDKQRKPSKWAHEMVEELCRTKGNPGGAYYNQLEKKGYGKEKIKKMKRDGERAAKWSKSGSNGYSDED